LPDPRSILSSGQTARRIKPVILAVIRQGYQPDRPRAAAHGWVGHGRIVYATSTEQMGAWLAELGVSPAPVRPLAISDVVRGVMVAGPVPGLAQQVRELHRRFHSAP
jgi:hypothetical protein